MEYHLDYYETSFYLTYVFDLTHHSAETVSLSVFSKILHCKLLVMVCCGERKLLNLKPLKFVKKHQKCIETSNTYSILISCVNHFSQYKIHSVDIFLVRIAKIFIIERTQLSLQILMFLTIKATVICKAVKLSAIIPPTARKKTCINSYNYMNINVMDVVAIITKMCCANNVFYSFLCSGLHCKIVTMSWSLFKLRGGWGQKFTRNSS